MDRTLGANYTTVNSKRMFTEGPPATTIPSTFLNGLQEELMAVIEGVGITPTNNDLGQLRQAIMFLAVQYANVYAPDTGVAANAYLVALSPAPLSYYMGLKVAFTTVNANNGASTINVNGLGVKSIKKAGSALINGDIVTTGLYTLIYDATNGWFNLITSPNADALLANGSYRSASNAPGANQAVVTQADGLIHVNVVGALTGNADTASSTPIAALATNLSMVNSGRAALTGIGDLTYNLGSVHNGDVVEIFTSCYNVLLQTAGDFLGFDLYSTGSAAYHFEGFVGHANHFVTGLSWSSWVAGGGIVVPSFGFSRILTVEGDGTLVLYLTNPKSPGCSYTTKNIYVNFLKKQ